MSPYPIVLEACVAKAAARHSGAGQGRNEFLPTSIQQEIAVSCKHRTLLDYTKANRKEVSLCHER
jgi:hypothetical protein